MVRQALRVGIVTVGVAAVWPAALAWAPTSPAPATVLADAARVEPTATAHPAVPRDLASLWLVPDARPVPPLLLKNFTRGIELVEAESFDEARPLLAAPALARTPVADYARYYTALIDLRRGEAVRARDAFHAIVAMQPAGVLGEWALVGEAMAAEQAGDFPAAAALYETLSKNKPEEPDTVLLGYARTLAASGNRERALQAYRDLYYGYPTSDVAGDARARMTTLGAAAAKDDARELVRAEALFSARRYADAQAAFESLPARSGDERELVALRLAECQHYLGRHRQALAALQPYLSGAKREAEARFFHLTATRALGDHASYVAAAKALASDFKAGAWTEETLNNLATHYIVTNDDASAGTVFADYLERFPRASTAPAPPGGSAGGGIAPATSRAPRRSSIGPPSASRGRTIVRAGCTGRGAPTPRPSSRRAPTPASSWSAPTISTRTTAASPVCTSARRRPRARRSAPPRPRPRRRCRRACRRTPMRSVS